MKIVRYILKKIFHIEQDPDYKSEHPTNFPIRLSPNEQKLFIENIKYSKKYLEFGSGGSTFLAELYSNADIVSVESDKNWLKFINQWKVIKHSKKIKFLYINIGKTGIWGYPVDKNSNRNRFPNYSKKVFQNFKGDFDTVFIDGRFRVACALQVLLNCNKDTKIIIHDYTDRTHYHIINKFMDIIQTTDTLVIMKIKENINFSQIEKLYQEYQYNPE